MKNIYTLVQELNFESKIDQFVSLEQKGAELSKDKMYMQNFVFGILQEFYSTLLEDKKSDSENDSFNSCFHTGALLTRSGTYYCPECKSSFRIHKCKSCDGKGGIFIKLANKL